MKPKQIRRLRRLIKSPGYLDLRWMLMWKESDAWWDEWLATRNNEDIAKSVMFRKRADWYSKKLNSNDTH